jgi:hypothetical protein
MESGMPNLRTLGITTVVAMAGLMALPAAVRATTRVLPTFDSVDANHDGVLSRSELPPQLADMRSHFRQYAYAGNRISRDVYQWYVASAALPPPTLGVARPIGSSARPQHWTPAPVRSRAQDRPRSAR